MLLTYSLTKAKCALCDVAQFVADLLGCFSRVHKILLTRGTDHAKPYSICFCYNIKVNEINICLDNWKHRLGLESARAALCKWAVWHQIFRSKTFTNSLNMKKLCNVYVIKEMVNMQRAIIELHMHLGGLLSTQEARVALGYRLVRLLRFFRA